MRMRDVRRILICGGGIAGLSAAIALRRKGYEAQVFERAQDTHTRGAGFIIWPNGLGSLDKMGLLERVLALGKPVATGGYYTSKGALLSEFSYDKLHQRLGLPILGIRRVDLRDELINALDNDALHLGSEAVGFTQDDLGVTLRFLDGREERGELLIIADGMRSRLRHQMLGQEILKYIGWIGWWGMIPTDSKLFPPSHYREVIGYGQRFGMFSLKPGWTSLYGGWNTPQPAAGFKLLKKDLLERFRGWPEPIETLIEATDEEAMTTGSIYYADPLSSWSTGLVTLLGDSAHPMTADLGQGACQAMEDAVVISECLEQCEDAAMAYRRYEELRIPRANKVARTSRRLGLMRQSANKMVCFLRNAMMKLTPADVFLRSYESLVKMQ
jgi:2-polyprenyl-6-methoxyphenol hydroxylase-like FAD-dependent oxidoreductase